MRKIILSIILDKEWTTLDILLFLVFISMVETGSMPLFLSALILWSTWCLVSDDVYKRVKRKFHAYL